MPKFKPLVGTTRESLPKGKREHSLTKHVPQMRKDSEELRLKAEAQGQKPPQQIEATLKKDQNETMENKSGNKSPISTSRETLPKRKREHSLEIHRKEIKRRFKELNEEAEAKSARLTQEDSVLMETYQRKTLLEIVSEKLTNLQHYPPEKGKPILAQLINYLVFNQESAGEGTEFELTVLALLDLSDKALHHYLFGWDTEGDQEECITKLLEKVTTEDEIYDIMIEDLLMTAISQWKEPEPD